MYKKLVLWLKNIFGFSTTEINGVIVLVVLSVIALVLPLFFKSEAPFATSNDDKRKLDSLVALFEGAQAAASVGVRPRKTRPAGEVSVELFDFDPNETEISDWLKLGVEERIARRIHKYLENGGRFRTKKDLSRIYGLPEATYRTLYNHIDLPAGKTVRHTIDKSQRLNAGINKKKREPKDFERTPLVRIDLNRAQDQDFLQFWGIGAQLSERIVKFRTRLGGFHSKEQLYDIYGLDSAIVQKIIDHSELGDQAVNRIDLNTISYDSLKYHPYVSYKLAKIIVNYRDLHERYESVDDLKNIHVIDEALFLKLEPYFKVE